MTNEPDEPLVDEDPFAGTAPIPGLEALGRAIVDEAGVPSGSPANFEATRGKGGPIITAEDQARIVADIERDFAESGLIDKP